MGDNSSEQWRKGVAKSYITVCIENFSSRSLVYIISRYNSYLKSSLSNFSLIKVTTFFQGSNISTYGFEPFQGESWKDANGSLKQI